MEKSLARHYNPLVYYRACELKPIFFNVFYVRFGPCGRRGWLCGFRAVAHGPTGHGGRKNPRGRLNPPRDVLRRLSV